MIIRKTACLLLALVFLLTISAPAVIADDTPPGETGGDIHPWDNTDRIGHSDNGDPATTHTRAPQMVIAWHGLGGRIVVSIAVPASWINNGQDQTRENQREKGLARLLRSREQSRQD